MIRVLVWMLVIGEVLLVGVKFILVVLVFCGFRLEVVLKI